MASGIAMLGTPVTEAGRFLGTPTYMAPEQLRGELGDARTDQFSFCVALYHALYSELPFVGETVGALLDRMMSPRPKHPPKSCRVPSWLRRVLMRGLSADRADRFESMDGLLKDLAPRQRAWPRQILIVTALVISTTTLMRGWIERSKRKATSARWRSRARG
jgi:serine/threonine protein kinase